jgi:hypothetical protein
MREKTLFKLQIEVQAPLAMGYIVPGTSAWNVPNLHDQLWEVHLKTNMYIPGKIVCYRWKHLQHESYAIGAALLACLHAFPHPASQ